MKVPKYIKYKLNQMAKSAKKIRKLDREFEEWCLKNEINTFWAEFLSNIKYISRDCSAKEIIEYIESLDDRRSS